jgi:CHAD domain-containing protein
MAPSIGPVALDPEEPALAGLRRVLAHLAETIEANRPGVIEDADPEQLHDLRIALRRTRSLLTETKGVLPRDVRRQHRRAFARLGRQTGPVRDLDVFQGVWQREVRRLHLDGDAGVAKVSWELEARRAAAHGELSRLLASDEVRGELDRWRRWLVDPHVEVDAGTRLGPVAAQRIERAQDRLLRDGRAVTAASPANRLHDLRKDAKRLRYLIEAFGSLLDRDGRKAFVGQLQELQDNLGAHQDADVQLGLLRLLARDLDAAGQVDTDTVLAVGRVSDRMVRRQARERRAFEARFRGYDTKRNRRALAALLAEIR